MSESLQESIKKLKKLRSSLRFRIAMALPFLVLLICWTTNFLPIKALKSAMAPLFIMIFFLGKSIFLYSEPDGSPKIKISPSARL